jgi:hypothetical protein
MLLWILGTILAVAIAAVGWGLQMWEIAAKPLGMALVGIGGTMILFVLCYGIWHLRKRRQARKIKVAKEADAPTESQQATPEVTLAISKANSSYVGEKKCFLVTVCVTLTATIVPLQLAWLRLVIAEKAFAPVAQTPKETDRIEHKQEVYEVQYEVDRHTCLKGRYADSKSRQSRENCWGYISANAGGQNWESEDFEIIPLPLK